MVNIDLQVLKDFELALGEDIPGFKVEFKNNSKFHKLLGFLTYPFNPFYMTSYISTIGKSVAFPTRQQYEANPLGSFVVNGHESVHMRDGIKHGKWGYERTYLAPQVYGLLPMLAYAIWSGVFFWIPLLPIVGYVLACWAARASRVLMVIVLAAALIATLWLAITLTGWKVLVLIAGLAFFAPWPSPGRTKWELRGYTTNIAIRHWLRLPVDEEFKQRLVKHFTSGDYYFMSWGIARIDNAITEAHNDVVSGRILDDSSYAFIHNFLKERSLLPV